MPYDTIDPSLLQMNQQPNFSWQSRAMNGVQGFLGNRDLALALLANSGPSTERRSFGQILGGSMLQADQAKQQRQDDEFKRAYMMAQMQAMQAKPVGPASVQEYQYAKQNGYKGSYEDWTKLSGQTSRPSSVQEWEFYNQLPQDQKRLYLEMKRNPDFQVKDVNQVPTVIAPSVVGGTQTTPLSTLPQITSSAEAVKQAEQRGGALGSAQGGIAGEIQKKGSNSKTVLSMVDEAERLIDSSTGSSAGALVDKGAAVVGKSTEGAKSIARLRVLQAGLMMNMPRMEGPQGEKDVELYQQAAAQIGDPNVPRETRKAALQTIKYLQQMYADRAGVNTGAAPKAGAVEDGYRFKGGDPSDPKNWEKAN